MPRARSTTSFRIVDFEGDVMARPIFAVAKLPFQGAIKGKRKKPGAASFFANLEGELLAIGRIR
jgi:hypothetical protein